jgi:CyaY protein
MDRALERAIDRMLEQLGEAVEALHHDEVEVELAPGLLTIDVGDVDESPGEHTRLIVSRQSATGQLWLAEPDGGWHFDLKNGLWIDDKRGLELTAALEKALGEALGVPVNLALA